MQYVFVKYVLLFLFFVQELFAGLSYTDSLKLIKILQNICSQLNKAIILTLDTPINHVIFACATLTLIHNEEVRIVLHFIFNEIFIDMYVWRVK